MDITHHTDDQGRTVITATVDPADEPLGDIGGMLLHDRLEAFLSVYGDPSLNRALELADNDMTGLLIRFAHVANMSATRLKDLMMRARDDYGLSWGQLSAYTELPRQTVKSRVERHREHVAQLEPSTDDDQPSVVMTADTTTYRPTCRRCHDGGRVRDLNIDDHTVRATCTCGADME